MKRTFIMEAQNKVISEWTLPKMLEIAKRQEKEEKELQSQMNKLLKEPSQME